MLAEGNGLGRGLGRKETEQQGREESSHAEQ
jgi:hypothetical protein